MLVELSTVVQRFENQARNVTDRNQHPDSQFDMLVELSTMVQRFENWARSCTTHTPSIISTSLGEKMLECGNDTFSRFTLF